MKKIVIALLLIIGFADYSNAQLVKHAKGTKTIGLYFTLTANSYIYQPYFGYFINSNVHVELNFLLENYSAKTNDFKMETVSAFVVKPRLNYSFFKVKNAVYFNLSAGLNVGTQAYEFYIYNVKPSKTEYFTSDIQIGPNIGLDCDVYLFKGLFLTLGCEYISIPDRLYGKNQVQFLSGLAYNFKFL